MMRATRPRFFTPFAGAPLGVPIKTFQPLWRVQARFMTLGAALATGTCGATYWALQDDRRRHKFLRTLTTTFTSLKCYNTGYSADGRVISVSSDVFTHQVAYNLGRKGPSNGTTMRRTLRLMPTGNGTAIEIEENDRANGTTERRETRADGSVIVEMYNAKGERASHDIIPAPLAPTASVVIQAPVSTSRRSWDDRPVSK